MSLYESQFYIFLVAVYGGIIAGLAYEFYRILRRIFLSKKITTAIFDTLFAATAVLIFIYVSYITSSGELRFYVVLGYVAGFLMYSLSISRVFNSIFTKIIKLFIKNPKT
ncbi:MAG: spore cortex biosynthesis protein YabQ [Eubacteriales bacterium]